jgi:hypothetical protein
MRCRAAFSCRLPPRDSRWRSVRPELTGTGATPACMAKQASERNRATPVGLGDELGRGQHPRSRAGRAASGPAGRHGAALPVQFTDLAGERTDRGDLVAAGGDLDRRSGLRVAWSSQAAVRPRPGPGSRRVARSRSGPAGGKCQRSRLACRVRSATRCSRWSTSSLTSQDAWPWPAVGRSGSRGRPPARRSARTCPLPGRPGGRVVLLPPAPELTTSAYTAGSGLMSWPNSAVTKTTRLNTRKMPPVIVVVNLGSTPTLGTVRPRYEGSPRPAR